MARRPRKPCPAWCRGHVGVGAGRGHLATLAVVDRPARRLSPVEELLAEVTGRTPPAVSVTASQLAGEPTRIDLAVNGTSLELSGAEARRVGWALVHIGMAVEHDTAPLALVGGAA